MTTELNPRLVRRSQSSADQTHDVLASIFSYETGSELHGKLQRFFNELYLGIWRAPLPGHGATDILLKTVALHNMTINDLPYLSDSDVSKLVIEVTFRILLEDKLPYDDTDFGDNLGAMPIRFMIVPEYVFASRGNVTFAAYKAARYQVQRYLQETGVVSIERMDGILKKVGLDGVISSTGSRSAYDLLFQFESGENFRTMVQRVRNDECEVKHLWAEAGPKAFILEHHRLMPRVFISDKQPVHLAAANLDPAVFEYPLKFDPARKNLHQAIVFNGLESDFDSIGGDDEAYPHPESYAERASLKRGCPGRHASLRMMAELGPFFFPAPGGYHCHNGLRARYGVEFTSSIMSVREMVNLEVLKTAEPPQEDSLFILIHGAIDVPLGWKAPPNGVRLLVPRNAWLGKQEHQAQVL